MADAPAAPEAPSRGLGGTLKRKIGPLPTWAWILIVGVIILGWALYRSRSKPADQTGTPPTGRGQVPQFVNQTWVQPQPPGPPDEDNDDKDDDDKDDRNRHSHRPPHPKPPPGRPPHWEPPPQHEPGGPPHWEPPPPRVKRHHRHRVHPPHIVHGGGRP